MEARCSAATRLPPAGFKVVLDPFQPPKARDPVQRRVLDTAVHQQREKKAATAEIPGRGASGPVLGSGLDVMAFTIWFD